MRKILIAITIAAAMLPAGAWAKPHHAVPGDADCLIGLDANGKEYCMTDAQEKAMRDKQGVEPCKPGPGRICFMTKEPKLHFDIFELANAILDKVEKAIP